MLHKLSTAKTDRGHRTEWATVRRPATGPLLRWPLVTSGWSSVLASARRGRVHRGRRREPRSGSRGVDPPTCAFPACCGTAPESARSAARGRIRTSFGCVFTTLWSGTTRPRLRISSLFSTTSASRCPNPASPDTRYRRPPTRSQRAGAGGPRAASGSASTPPRVHRGAVGDVVPLRRRASVRVREVGYEPFPLAPQVHAVGPSAHRWIGARRPAG